MYEVISVTPKHGLSWWVKWVGTVLLLAAGATAAAGFVPLNFLIGLVGCICWTVVGLLWHDRSLMILNSVSAVFCLMAYLNF